MHQERRGVGNEREGVSGSRVAQDQRSGLANQGVSPQGREDPGHSHGSSGSEDGVVGSQRSG